MLGLAGAKAPRFVRNFMQGSASIEDAILRYVAAVKDQSFPDPALHCF
jgi:3-methyl-2-oxobutanoate hydroxymethyltransferase